MLILVPTELEAAPLRDLGLRMEIIGMGPVEAAVSAYEIFQQEKSQVAFLAGLAGAYPESGLSVGDLVLAIEEAFGDLAICYPERLGTFGKKLPVKNRLSLRSPYLEKAVCILEENEFHPEVGPLVTVCCATRDPERALLFGRRYAALAENMEGFGVALAAEKAGVTLIELRTISNLLEKPEDPWETERALSALKEALRCLSKNWR
ncbi:hypothetical protein [Thermosulfurimonas dismutans]|nr:hypothetical protein [Thermosulfurimonas dismutans]